MSIRRDLPATEFRAEEQVDMPFRVTSRRYNQSQPASAELRYSVGSARYLSCPLKAPLISEGGGFYCFLCNPC